MPDEKSKYPDDYRMCLYNKDGGTMFTGNDAIEAAFEAGYVDHPDKVKKPAPAKKAAKKKGK